MRLILVTLSVIFVLIFVWVSLYLWGLGRPVFMARGDFLPESRIYVKSPVYPHSGSEYGHVIEVFDFNNQLFCFQKECDKWFDLVMERPTLWFVEIRSKDLYHFFLNQFLSRNLKFPVAIFSRDRRIAHGIKKQLPGVYIGLDKNEEHKLLITWGLRLHHLLNLDYDFWLLFEDQKIPTSLLEFWKSRHKVILCHKEGFTPFCDGKIIEVSH